MQTNKTTIWARIAIFEASVILVLLVVTFPKQFRFFLKDEYVRATISPLRLGADYGLPDDKFDQLVKDYSGWISYRTHFEGGDNVCLLADCALLRQTNYVRILIANGANVEEAVKDNLKIDKGSVELLHQIQKEVADQTTNTVRAPK